MMTNTEPQTESPVFTADNNPEIARILTETLKTLAVSIASSTHAREIRAVYLGGGYGRGEGGVFTHADGSISLHNDLDFFVFTENATTHSVRRRIDREMAELAAPIAQSLGIDVDFAAARTLASLNAVKNTLMFQELRAGHVFIFGDAGTLENAIPPLPPNDIPVSEGARLMMNRGAGLLLSSQRLESDGLPGDNAAFITRNISKANLGCGDAVLIAAHQYAFSLKQRAQNIKNFDAPGILVAPYANAVAFKQHPVICTDKNKLRADFLQACTIWRTAIRHIFCPNTPDAVHVAKIIRHSPLAASGHPLRNAAVNLVMLLTRGMNTHTLLGHPRTALLAELDDLLVDAMKDSVSSEFRLKREKWLARWQRFS